MMELEDLKEKETSTPSWRFGAYTPSQRLDEAALAGVVDLGGGDGGVVPPARLGRGCRAQSPHVGRQNVVDPLLESPAASRRC